LIYQNIKLFRRLIKIVNFILHIQGGAMNRGLLFAGPPPPPFGVCEQKDKRNPLRGRPSNTFHMGAPVGGRQPRCYITGRQPTAKSFARDRRFMKICPAPSASWNLILKMKKLLNDSLDLT
jgi:hypothetical protein